MADTLGMYNPFRYRGYVWDEETWLYYVSSRYYNPETGRFINADIIVSTGQGVLGSNMFAYCRNNPVRRRDVSGAASVELFDANGNLLTDDVLSFDGGTVSSGGFGGGTWEAFMRSMQDGLDGLKMASGQRNWNRTENHHLISNKREWSSTLKDILNQNGYPLNDPSNIVPLEKHRGRHTDAYHEFIFDVINHLNAYSNGNYDLFVKGMEELGKFIRDFPWLPYAQPK